VWDDSDPNAATTKFIYLLPRCLISSSFWLPRHTLPGSFLPTRPQESARLRLGPLCQPAFQTHRMLDIEHKELLPSLLLNGTICNGINTFLLQPVLAWSSTPYLMCRLSSIPSGISYICCIVFFLVSIPEPASTSQPLFLPPSCLVPPTPPSFRSHTHSLILV